MLSLLGAALGFFTSFLPKVMDYFQDKRDKAHELALLDKQIQMQEKLHGQRIEEINVQADIEQIKALYKHDAAIHEKAAPWVSTLSSSVRPVITYSFFALFVFVEVGIVFKLVDIGIIHALWTDETQALFAAVMSFWFGQRTVAKWKQGSR